MLEGCTWHCGKRVWIWPPSRAWAGLQPGLGRAVSPRQTSPGPPAPRRHGSSCLCPLGLLTMTTSPMSPSPFQAVTCLSVGHEEMMLTQWRRIPDGSVPSSLTAGALGLTLAGRWGALMAPRASTPPRRAFPKMTRVGDRVDLRTHSPTPFCCVHQLESTRGLPGCSGMTRSDAACPRSSSTHASMLPAALRAAVLLPHASTKPLCSRVGVHGVNSCRFALACKCVSPQESCRRHSSAPRRELLPRQLQFKEIPAGKSGIGTEQESIQFGTCPMAGSGAGTASP